MIDIEKALKDGGINDPLTIVKCKYGFEILKTEVTKFLWMGLFFFVIGKLPLYLFANSILVPVRIYTGGMHMETKWGCQIYSFSFMLITISVLPLIKMPFNLYFIFIGLSLMCTIIIAPIKNPLRPVETLKRYKKIRFRAILFTLMASMIVLSLLAFKLYSFFYVGVYVLFLNSIQLIPPYIACLMKGEKCYEEVK